MSGSWPASWTNTQLGEPERWQGGDPARVPSARTRRRARCHPILSLPAFQPQGGQGCVCEEHAVPWGSQQPGHKPEQRRVGSWVAPGGAEGREDRGQPRIQIPGLGWEGEARGGAGPAPGQGEAEGAGPEGSRPIGARTAAQSQERCPRRANPRPGCREGRGQLGPGAGGAALGLPRGGREAWRGPPSLSRSPAPLGVTPKRTPDCEKTWRRQGRGGKKRAEGAPCRRAGARRRRVPFGASAPAGREPAPPAGQPEHRGARPPSRPGPGRQPRPERATPPSEPRPRQVLLADPGPTGRRARAETHAHAHAPLNPTALAAKRPRIPRTLTRRQTGREPTARCNCPTPSLSLRVPQS